MFPKTITKANTSLDDYVNQGIYFFATAVSPVNIPSGSNGWLFVMPSADPYTSNAAVKQMWMRFGTAGSNDGQTFIRTRNTMGVWGKWWTVEVG